MSFAYLSKQTNNTTTFYIDETMTGFIYNLYKRKYFWLK